MAWYLNPALTHFRNEVNTRWPNRDKTTDGTIGDPRHQLSKSDHNQDPDGSVDAWDMDVDGVPVATVIAAALKHESIQYVIYNRKITSRSKPGGLGTWHPYEGDSPHTEHVHFNTRESYENSTKPWFTEEDELAGWGFDTGQAADDVAFRVNKTNVAIQNEVKPALAALQTQVTALTAAVTATMNDADKTEIIAAITAQGDAAAGFAMASAQRDADMLAAIREFQSGGASAEEVINRIGLILSS